MEGFTSSLTNFDLYCEILLSILNGSRLLNQTNCLIYIITKCTAEHDLPIWVLNFTIVKIDNIQDTFMTFPHAFSEQYGILIFIMWVWDCKCHFTGNNVKLQYVHL